MRNARVVVRRVVGLVVASSLVITVLPGGPLAVSQTKPSAEESASVATRLLEQQVGSELTASDPSVLAAVARSGVAPGPASVTGPGEVPPIAAPVLPVGQPTAMELVGDSLPASVAKLAVPTPGSDEEPVLVLPPPPPVDTTKGKRRRTFDKGSSKRSNRKADEESFDNADGSKTVFVGGQIGRAHV